MFVSPEREFPVIIALLVINRRLLSISRHHVTAFIVEGFQNWKGFHENSDMHKDALFKYSCSQHPTISQQLSTAAAKEMRENRETLLKVLSSLSFLLKQGLSIRGHTSELGNLYQLLELRSEDCPLLARWLCNCQYISPVIVNEMIN